MIFNDIAAAADGNISSNYMTPEGVKSALNAAISKVADEISNFVCDPSADMTRKRKIPPEKLFRFFLSREGKSLRSEICDQMPAGEEFRASALSMQRYKVNHKAFEQIMIYLNEFISPQNTFRGFHILASDGSDVNIPFIDDDPDLIIANGDNKPYCQIHLNALFDCLEEIYWDAEISTPSKTMEPEALLNMASRRRFPADSIIICDRGYESYRVMAELAESGQKFLIRCKDKDRRTSILKRFDFPDDETDAEVSVILTRSNALYNTDRKKYAFLNARTEFPLLPSHSSGTYKLSYRVVRLRLDDGSYEALVTNLTEEEMPFESMKYLYHLRWGIETSFRSLKHKVGMIYLNAKKKEGILQEVYSSLIMFNFASAIKGCIHVSKKEKAIHDVKINFSCAITNVRQFFRDIIAEETLIRRIEGIVIPIRPGRSAPRNVKSQCHVPLNKKIS